MPDVDPQNGLVLPDEYFLDLTYLAANDGSANGSDYTEADPRPGQVTAVDGQTLVPVITNAQDQAVTVRVHRSGYAGVTSLSYALADGIRRGWNGVVPIGWELVSGLYTTSDDWSLFAATVLPQTQTVVVVYAEVGTGSVYSRTRAPDSETWSSQVEVTAASANALGLVVTPDGMLVMVRCGTANRISTHYSVDGGTTWAVLARAEDVGVGLGFTPTQTRFAACLVGDSQILVFASTSLQDTVQLASPDQGITWSRLGQSSTPDFGLSLARANDGSAVLAYFDAGTNDVMVRRFPTAYVMFDAAQEVDTGATGGTQVAVAVDADGTIYVLHQNAVTAPDHALGLVSSPDEGTTWTTPTVILDLQDDGSTILQGPVLVAAAGRLWLHHYAQTAASSVDGSRGVVKLASWTSHEWTSIPDMTWLPIEMPDQTGWTAAGTGTGSLELAHLKIETSADTRNYRWDGSGHSFTPALHAFAACTAGASASAGTALQLIATSASATYTMRVTVWTTGFRVTDNVAGSTIVNVVIDGTLDHEFLLFFEGAGSARLLYKRPNDVLWTEVDEVAAHAFSDGGALESNCAATVGVLSAATVTGWHRFISFYEDFDGVVSGTSLLGKRLAGAPYPLADVADADGRVGHLSLRGGLGLNGHSYSLPEQHTYQIEHVFPGLHPSPTEREWRSEDTSEQILAFDLGGRAWLGGALAVLFERVNFETAHLEYHDGSTWQTLATYNGADDFGGLSYERTGGSVYPPISGSTADSERMLQDMELANGGWARFNDGVGGSDVLRRVCQNTTGWWSTATGATRPVVTLDDIDGSEPAGGTIHLVSPGGLLVAYLSTLIMRQRWRIRIPAQDTVDGYFRAGLISTGRVMPFAQPWAWGWSQEERGQFDSFRDRAGNERRTRRGGIVRSWTLSHSDGVPMLEPRSITAGRSVGIVGGLNLEPVASVLFQLRGALRRTRGQVLPVVAVSALPQTSTTITDRTLYLLGHLTNSLATTVAQGREGVDEVIRTEGVRVDGFPED